jgi:hypothetical protein
MLETLPAGFYAKGVSSLLDKDGKVVAQWVKAHQGKQLELEQLLEACKVFAEPWKGKSTPIKAPKDLNDELIAMYIVGDPHAGMQAWYKECGESFDLTMFENDLVSGIDALISKAPPAKVGFLALMGDTFHADGEAGTTTKGTRVDVDSRWTKVLQVVIRTVKHSIHQLLAKHEKVVVESLIGNHDRHLAYILAVILHEHFENNPRVEVNLSPDMFRFYQHGECLIGLTHGHTVKAEALPQIMATDRAKEWGESYYRHWYTGHVHHQTHKEMRGCSVETCRTLAPKDWWHHASGYRSQEGIKCDVWHKTDGRIDTHQVGLRTLRRLQRAQGSKRKGDR